MHTGRFGLFQFSENAVADGKWFCDRKSAIAQENGFGRELVFTGFDDFGMTAACGLATWGVKQVFVGLKAIRLGIGAASAATATTAYRNLFLLNKGEIEQQAEVFADEWIG